MSSALVIPQTTREIQMLMSFFLGKALPLILKVIVGPLTYLIGRVLLNAWAKVDDLSPAAKRFAVFIIALVISGILHVTGQEIPGECSALITGDVADTCVSILKSGGFLSATVSAALGSGMAFLIHAEKKSNPAS